jgi:hypothetical protein
MPQQLKHITSPATAIPSNSSQSIDPQDCRLLPKEIDDINFDTAVKVAFAGFFRAGEITCEASDLINTPVFEHTKLQRRDVTFSDDDEYAIITLRHSKCDIDHTGVEIFLAGTDTSTCPIAALQALLCLDPQPRQAPLFRTHKGPCQNVDFITDYSGGL